MNPGEDDLYICYRKGSPHSYLNPVIGRIYRMARFDKLMAIAYTDIDKRVTYFNSDWFMKLSIITPLQKAIHLGDYE